MSDPKKLPPGISQSTGPAHFGSRELRARIRICLTQCTFDKKVETIFTISSSEDFSSVISFSKNCTLVVIILKDSLECY